MLKIRLAKFGKKNAPTYKIVVTQARDKRNGKFVDVLGHYNPHLSDNQLVLDKKKFDEWLGNGAQPTKAAKDLYDGSYDFVEYNPKKAKQSAEQNANETNSNDSGLTAQEEDSAENTTETSQTDESAEESGDDTETKEGE